jgi:C-terminal processing protease CtpA/Prc
MLNFDMVGRMQNNHVIVYGVATAQELNDIVMRANAASPLELTATGDGFGASDQTSFYTKNLPVLHFFTNVHEDYHKATDDVDKVNAAGIARVVSLAERVTRDIADRPQPLTFVRAVAAAPTMSTRDNTSAYLGSIPDMGATEVKGVRLTGVRAESPADKAGLKAGDVIAEFAGKPVNDLYAYTDALYAQKPGDTIDVVVLRGTEGDGQGHVRQKAIEELVLTQSQTMRNLLLLSLAVPALLAAQVPTNPIKGSGTVVLKAARNRRNRGCAHSERRRRRDR